MPNDTGEKKIILSTNLKGFFYDGLSELNKKSLCPVPESIIYYSSDVLDKFALSEMYFETSEGKIREKILGIKLLEATQQTRDVQKRVYKEVGDMSLLICGFFSESVNKKIIDKQYYGQLGRMAYSHLNTVTPKFLDIPDFYGMVATCFGSLTTLLMLLASQERGFEKNIVFEKVLRDEPVSDQELLVSGVVATGNRKVS
jgi:hypothetical protein